MRLSFLVFLGVALASCDAADPSRVTFMGADVRAVGGATLRPSGGRLVVENIPAGAEGGIAVVAPARLDATVDPIALPDGARFGTRVEAAGGAEIASMTAVGLPLDRVRFLFSYGAAAGVTSVQLRYRLGGAVVFTLGPVPVAAGKTLALVAEQSAGEGSGETGSVHAVRDGGRWVVVSDSGGGSSRGTAGRAADGGCEGFVVRPPAISTLPPPPDAVCTDWVEIVPLTGTPPEAVRTVVVARGLPAFTVRTLSAQ